MIRGTLLKICFGVFLVAVIGVALFTQLYKGEETTTKEKTKVTDFAKGTPVDMVIAFSNNSNFRFVLPKGTYNENDAIYVMRKGSNNTYSNTLFAKYIITESDVEKLALESLTLSLSCAGIMDKAGDLILKYDYFIIKSSEIEKFESIYNKPNSQGEVKELLFQPKFQTFDLCGSMIDLAIDTEERDLDNEVIQVVLMQSQVYEDAVVKIFGPDNTVIHTQALTDREIADLQHKNVTISVEMAEAINSVEGLIGFRTFVFVLEQDGERLITKSFNLTFL